MRQYRLCFDDGTERQVEADGYRVVRKNIIFRQDKKVVISIGKECVIMIEETTSAGRTIQNGMLPADHGKP